MSEVRTGPRDTIDGFREWMAVIVMLSGGTMLALMVSALAPVMHLVAAHFAGKRDGDLVAQMVVTVPSIGVITGGLISGWLVRIFGAKRLFLYALAVFGIGGSAGLYLDDVLILLGARFILGLGIAGIVTAMISLIGENFTAEARAKVLGWQSAAGAGSGVAVLFLAGDIGNWGGWRAPFGLYLLPFLVIVLGAIYLPPSQRRTGATAASQPVDWMALVRLWPLYAVMIPMFVAVYMPSIQVSFLLRDDGIVGPQVQSYVILAGAAVVSLAALSYGWLSRWLTPGQNFLACFVFQGLGIIVMGLSHDAVGVAAGCAVLGIGTGISNPLISDWIIGRTSPEMRGPAIGLSYTARYLGDFFNPWIMLPLGRALGLHTAFLWVGAAFLVGVVVAVIWRQAAGKPAAAAG